MTAEADNDWAVCPNCGRDEHTPEELSVCISSIVGPPRCSYCDHVFLEGEHTYAGDEGRVFCYDCAEEKLL